ncbi:MAG: hypothetical protein ACRDPI_09025 [Nocardioidaceae bacterium]
MSALRSLALAVSAAVVGILVVTLTPVASLARVPGPIHAGNTYGWYRSHLWRQEFKGRKPAFWHVKGPGIVRDQHGMLTLNTSTRGTVSATLARPGHRVGRWEIRLRSRRYETGHTNYRVVTELIPSGTRPYHCGARNVALENYVPGGHRVQFYIRTLPNNNFGAFDRRGLRNDQWHTFAVEVTRKHISWFVDAHVVRTERRAAALKGVPLTLRFEMQATPGVRMNRSRMQMDWMRFWTTETPDTKSIKAPRTQLTTYQRAC